MNYKTNRALTAQEKESRKTEGRGRSLMDCAKELQTYGAAVAVLQLQDLQAYWLSIMSDPKADTKDKLTASKLYAQSIGGLDKTRRGAGDNVSGYRYAWRAPSKEDQPIIDVEQAN